MSEQRKAKRKIPVEAIQFTGNNHGDIVDFIGENASIDKCHECGKKYTVIYRHPWDRRITVWGLYRGYFVVKMPRDFYYFACSEDYFKEHYVALRKGEDMSESERRERIANNKKMRLKKLQEEVWELEKRASRSRGDYTGE